MDALFLSVIIICTSGLSKAVTMISSSDRATVGANFTFTCATNARAITFQKDEVSECTIIGGDANGTCFFAGTSNTNYKYYCNNITDTYKLTIPSSFDIYTLHGSNWKCFLPLESGRESKSIQLYVNRVTLTSSSDKATVGIDFTLICGTNARAITFQRDRFSECTIIGGDGNGICTFAGDYNKNYKYECFTSPGVYKLTIPSSFDIDILHGSNWTCTLPLESSKQSEIIQLYINVPITEVTITTIPIDKNPIEIVLDTNQNFRCRTNAGRPSSRIQWYISGTNISGSAIPQTDVCNNNCNGKVISSSEVSYTGITSIDGTTIYCTAINIEGQSVRSVNKSIVIWYGPSNVTLSPHTQIYTVNESTGSVGPVTCIPYGCKPTCVVKWSGPDLLGYTSSVLNLQNITRNKAGNYFCTVSNVAWSMISVNLSVIVHYGPRQVNISPPNQTYTATESTGYVGPIKCIADCKPECIMTWNGPDLSDGITSVLQLQNLAKTQAGYYSCNASNIVGSLTSVGVNVIVNFGPTSINLSPDSYLYIVTETKGINIILCEAVCKPDCNYTWTGPNGFREYHSHLLLNSVYRNHTGLYTCNAQNDFGSQTSEHINIIVNYAPTILRLQTLISNTIEEHQPVTFQCEVDSYPAPDITWIFSRTNTLLFKDEHVFKSNYTLPKTMCLQTGSYRCQGSNVIDAVLVDAYREIDLFVLCSVRMDQRYQEPPDDIAVMEKDTFNITVYLISYPKPSISWTMKHPDTGIISTVTNNSTFNVFEHTSTVHIGIMSKNDYGIYKINAFNNIGLLYTKSFSVIPQGPPIQPTDVLVTCEKTSMLVSWLPGFNGGITQTFRVSWLNLKTQHTELSPEIMDSTQGQNKQHIVRSLDPGTMYIVYVEAFNKHGIVRSTKNANCTTGSSLTNSSLPMSIGVGIGSSVLILIMSGIVVFVMKRRIYNKEENRILYQSTNSGTSRQKTNTDQHNYSELQTIQPETNPKGRQTNSLHTYEEIGRINDGYNHQDENLHNKDSREEHEIATVYTEIEN